MGKGVEYICVYMHVCEQVGVRHSQSGEERYSIVILMLSHRVQ